MQQPSITAPAVPMYREAAKWDEREVSGHPRSPKSSRENNGKRTAEGSAARLINEGTGPYTRSDTNRDFKRAKLPEEVSGKRVAPKATYKDPKKRPP